MVGSKVIFLFSSILAFLETILFSKVNKTDDELGSVYIGSFKNDSCISSYIRFTPSFNSLTYPNSVNTLAIRGFLEYLVYSFVSSS